MLSESQKKAAAIRLCELRGIDPKTIVPHEAESNANGYVPAVLLYSQAWVIALREIAALDMQLEAIRFAAESDDK